MTLLHIIYWTGCTVGITMFGASWLIRRRRIEDGPAARAELPLMAGGAVVALTFAVLGMLVL